ncbi:hypothetical protein NDU88_001794 [Pleurodeles waltl]|uniref:Uncharacterized protein n=1 Tax=Pleurodeles waltl TaxID=8319 RepID=A0AAV7RE09_PLEWA|nr:hypothetical protein NDU88_001794 [Pleurodeles waltl]
MRSTPEGLTGVHFLNVGRSVVTTLDLRRLRTHEEYPRGTHRSPLPQCRTERCYVRRKTGIEEELLKKKAEEDIGARADSEEEVGGKEDRETDDREDKEQNGVSLEEENNTPAQMRRRRRTGKQPRPWRDVALTGMNWRM